MKISIEVNNDWQLFDMCWSGGRDTVQQCLDAGKGDELFAHIEDVFSCSENVTDTEINDYLWFDSDHILAELGVELYLTAELVSGEVVRLRWYNGTLTRGVEVVAECDFDELEDMLLQHFAERGEVVESIITDHDGETLFHITDIAV